MEINKIKITMSYLIINTFIWLFGYYFSLFNILFYDLSVFIYKLIFKDVIYPWSIITVFMIMISIFLILTNIVIHLFFKTSYSFINALIFIFLAILICFFI
jgi:hypothetical protein